MTSSDSKIEKIQTHFKALSSVAHSLNTASDQLTKVVSALDEPLKKLNVGLTVWLTFRRRDVEEWEYDEDQIGYAKVNGKWGIALRRIWGDNRADHFGDEGPWSFNDAPRDMRIAGVDKIPEVIEALGKEAFETTKTIHQKTEEVRELAGVIEKLTSQPSSTDRSKKAGKRIAAGLSVEQLTAIFEGVLHQQKSLGELLGSASCWKLVGSNLHIYFPAAKRQFSEQITGPGTHSTIAGVAKEVLGFPVQLVVKLEPPVMDTSAAGNDKGASDHD
jgi:hypothetical protein